MLKIEDQIALANLYRGSSRGFTHDGCVKRLTDINTGEFIWFDGTRFITAKYYIKDLSGDERVTTPDSIVHKLMATDSISGFDSYNYNANTYYSSVIIAKAVITRRDELNLVDILQLIHKASVDVSHHAYEHRAGLKLKNHIESWGVNEIVAIDRMCNDMCGYIIAIILLPANNEPILDKPTLHRVK